MRRPKLRYDTILKDMFEHDRPSLLNELTGGVAIRAFLNVELPKVIERRVDCLAQLENGRLCHIEFQSQNHRKMPYRQGIYGLLLADKFNCAVDQTVIYMGSQPLRMQDSLDAGSVKVGYRLVDIRQFKAEDLARSANPADRALAILGAGSSELVHELVASLASLATPVRERAIIQLSMLAGLRRLAERVTMEVESMSMTIDISKHPFLKGIRDQGKDEGRVEGQAKTIGSLLEIKFGRLPAWAAQRLSEATPEQLERWTSQVLTADTLTGVLGPKA